MPLSLSARRASNLISCTNIEIDTTKATSKPKINVPLCLMKKLTFILGFVFALLSVNAQDVQVALLKYKGGGDWYANPTSLPNLVKFCNRQLGTDINPEVATVEVGSREIFNYPFVHITGHGNIILSPEEVENLRNYLIAGGFLEVSDNYGLDQYIRREMKKVFPGLEFTELPFNHPVYHQQFNFSHGLPKIHRHDGKNAQGFGIIYKGRLVVFYDYECDLGDGWEDTEVHHDSQQKHLEALRMGANIVQFVFGQ